MDQPLVLHVDKHEGHYRLLLENLSDDALEGVEILSVFPQGYDGEMIIKFEPLKSLDPHSTVTVPHKVQIPKEGDWADDQWITNDMLMCLTNQYSKGEKYEVNASWSVGGVAANQTLMAGAGSEL
jgi:hypothetical protein